MPTTSINEALLEQLKKVKGPDLESNIVDLGLVSNIHFEKGKASLFISVPAERAAALEPMRAAAEKVILELDIVETALVVLTDENEEGLTTHLIQADQIIQSESIFSFRFLD